MHAVMGLDGMGKRREAPVRTKRAKIVSMHCFLTSYHKTTLSIRMFVWQCAIAKMTAQCPENFRDSLVTPTATFLKIFHGFLFRSTL